MVESAKSSFKISDVDLTHHYYNDHSDHPLYSLVPIKLNGTNYQSWCQLVLHDLIAKRKIGFIDGTIEEPSQDANSTEFELWNQFNSMIISLLTHSVEADIADEIILTKECSSNFSDTNVDNNDVIGNHGTVSIFHQAQSTLG